MNLTVLTSWLRVLGAVFPPQTGVSEGVVAFLAEVYVVFVGLGSVLVLGVAVYLDELPENLDVFIDL